jgi:hypothetical protein
MAGKSRVVALKGVARPSWHGRRLIAASMYQKGKHFVLAALLLRQKGGYEYVVLHLLCQGIEITLKALLLSADYDTHRPKLRSYGHDLLRLILRCTSSRLPRRSSSAMSRNGCACHQSGPNTATRAALTRFRRLTSTA